MLIGKFANYFEVKTDTVRYYMKLGLLLPKKQNHYYYFDQTCVEEMELIQKLKFFRFSLGEIHKILTLKRITSLSSVDDVNFLIQMLADKKTELQKDIQEVNDICSAIDNKITEIQASTKVKDASKNGVDFSFISILNCPNCQNSLELTDMKTKGQQIFMGKVYCPNCDYKAIIEEGIMITEHLSEESFNPFYIYDIEMFKKINSSFVNLSERASMYVKQNLLNKNLRGKFILETNVDTYVFLDKYITTLQADAYYIFTGSTLPMLKMLKRKIENINPNIPVLYVLNSGMNLPFKHESIDHFIDSYSFNEFSLFHNKLPMKMLKPYLHNNTTIIGCYFQYNNNAKTLKEMRELHPNAYPYNLNSQFSESNLTYADFQFSEKEYIGDIKDPGQYIKYHIPGDLAFFFVYQAHSIK